MKRTLILMLLASLGCEDDGSGGTFDPDVPVRSKRDRGTQRPLVDMGRLPVDDGGLDADESSDGPPEGDDAGEVDGALEVDGEAPETDGDVPELDASLEDPDGGESDAAEPDAGLDPDAAIPDPDAGGNVAPACLAAIEEANFDFETGAQGFAHAAMDGFDGDNSWRFDHWENGAARSGPGACVGGNGCFATNLTGNYIQCQRAQLQSPDIDLSACAGEEVLLVFDHWYDFVGFIFDGAEWYDGGTVEISNGAGFNVVAPHRYRGRLAINPFLPGGFSGYSCLAGDEFHVHGLPGFTLSSDGWETPSLPLEPAQIAQPFRIRFAYATGVSEQTNDPQDSQRANPPGWYIDNVRFELR